MSVAAAVSAAAGSHGAGAAAAAGALGGHARRLRDMLSVAEEEIEVWCLSEQTPLTTGSLGAQPPRRTICSTTLALQMPTMG